MQEYTNDPQIDREIIDSIQPEYFTDDNFDAAERELQVVIAHTTYLPSDSL